MLQTLKGLKDINGTKIMTNDDRPINVNTGEVDWNEFDKMREEFPICIDHEKDMVSFKLMTKPAKEGGTGCQHVDMIHIAKHIIEFFSREEEKKLTKMLDRIQNGSFTSDEESEELRAKYDNTLTSFNANKQTVMALTGALYRQTIRTSDRELRGVEGTSRD